MPPLSRQLKRYHQKRDFSVTEEPAGGAQAPKPGFRYLIQKHAASHLHYDFRLEMEGVLKSWAVTKGPSLSPVDKRLAVHVEDHPIEYGNFEGIIPKGQYGGGTVMLWDEGTWEPIGDYRKDYKQGRLHFVLHGKRLKGAWHLVRMHHHPKDKRDNWLLIKGSDEYAKSAGDAVLKTYTTSVVSHRTMEAISRSEEVWHETKKNKKIRGKDPFPPWVDLALATLVKQPPEGKDWIHEIKFDGYRILARLEKGNIRLFTRTGKDWTERFHIIAESLADLPARQAWLDGEVVTVEKDGSMHFHALQQALSMHDPSQMHYFIFDLLYLDGKDLRKQPLLERKRLLKELLGEGEGRVRYSEHFEVTGQKMLKHACGMNFEGVVSKQKGSQYHAGRGDEWLKSKCLHMQEFVIGGYTCQSKSSRRLGALLIGYYAEGTFIFAGKVGTGYSSAEAEKILKKLQALQRKKNSFDTIPAAYHKGAHWVKPQLVCEVRFTEWTPSGVLRHPSYQGLREDKPAREVRKELESKIILSKKKNISVSRDKKVEVAGIRLSNPGKVLYPAQDITKLQLAEYYERIADWILPHIADRPLSLLRCPEGSAKTCFFQRHIHDFSSSPHLYPVPVTRKGKSYVYLSIKDLAGLVSLVQLGVLEIHPWGAKANAPTKPDRMIFDFDPSPEVPFSRVKEAAIEMKERLKEEGLVSFLKVTGGKGLHVVVPLSPGPSWAEVKEFSRHLAAGLEKDDPAHFTTNSRKAGRAGKIFIDYLRNDFSATSVAAYSTRAREGAPIAMPLAWSELEKLEKPDSYTLPVTAKRLSRLKKDPWKEMLELPQALP